MQICLNLQRPKIFLCLMCPYHNVLKCSIVGKATASIEEHRSKRPTTYKLVMPSIETKGMPYGKTACSVPELPHFHALKHLHMPW